MNAFSFSPKWIKVLSVLLLLVGNGNYAASQEKKEDSVSLISRIQALLSPGPLCKAHAEVDNAAGCNKCHMGLQGLSDKLCLECHKPIADRMKTKSGYHGKLKEPCNSCHAEHKGRKHDIVNLDEKQFNHDEALFRLAGKHRELECKECHTVKGKERKFQKRFFIGVPRDCEGCHKDPHENQFIKDKKCETCHGMEGWNGKFLNFDHDRDSQYPLSGAHRKVECAKCHGEGDYRHGRTSCLECHKDPHNGQFDTDKSCEICHVTESWKGRFLLFDHNEDSRFKLTGAHTAVDCNKCHNEGSWRNGKVACKDCHEDVHRGIQVVEGAHAHTTG